MNYNELRIKTAKGWNTWNSSNVLSHVLLPCGFAINLGIKDFTKPLPLKCGCIDNNSKNGEKITPFLRSYNGSFTELKLEYGDTVLNIKTTADDENQYILVTPEKVGIKMSELIIEGCILYGGDGFIGKENGRIYGKFKDREITVFVNAKDTKLQYTDTLNPCVTVKLDREILISTKETDINSVKSKLNSEREKLIEHSKKYGENRDAYNAMKSCLAWDTVYDGEHERICSTVSRTWNKNFGGYVLFDWDTYFAAVLASVDSKELAYLNLFAITHEMTDNGFVPNYAAAHGIKSFDRSQPPVGALCALKIYNKFKEKWVLEELYPYFYRWNTWFYEKRMTDDGYMCWGSNAFPPYTGAKNETEQAQCRFGAALESGLDNSPMYDNMTFDKETGRSSLADVGLMSMYIADCMALAEIGEITGKNNPELKERAEKVKKRLDTMWSENDGIYLNYDLKKREFSDRLSPTLFYPLLCGDIPKERVKRMINEHFYNENEFWGKYIIPSIARNDAAYKDQNYWRGRIWAPHNYLVYEAFKAAGETDICCVIAEKSRELICKEWLMHGHVHENYNGDTGEGCDVENSDCFYHWSGLLAYIAIDCEKDSKKPLS